MLRYDKSEDMLYYGSEIVCEVGYAGPVLDLLIKTFNDMVPVIKASVNRSIFDQLQADDCPKRVWRERIEQLEAIAQGRAEFR